MKINLHMHSNYSDGTMDIPLLMQTMGANNFKVVALTDHDRTDGVEEALRIGNQVGIKVITGIEVSSNNNNLLNELGDHSSIHILGLGFDLSKLESIYKQRRFAKELLARKLIDQLQVDGYEITYTLNEVVSSTTIGDKLIESGFAANLDEVFSKIINERYAKYRLPNMDIKMAIDTIHQSGGYAIWAHPFETLVHSKKISMTPNQIENIVPQLVELGLDGIETYYAKYSADQIYFLESLATQYDLLSSVGSDFHGKNTDEWITLNKECLTGKERLPLVRALLKK